MGHIGFKITTNRKKLVWCQSVKHYRNIYSLVQNLDQNRDFLCKSVQSCTIQSLFFYKYSLSSTGFTAILIALP